MTYQKIGSRAKETAEEMLRATEGTGEDDEPLSEDNSRKRIIAPELRLRFIELRTSMHRIGLIDPVLNRFDSYTVPQATSREVAERLDEIAEALAGSEPR